MATWLKQEQLSDLHHIAGGELLITAHQNYARGDHYNVPVLLTVLYKTRLSRLGFEVPDSTPDSSLSPLNAKQHIFDLLAQSETDIFSAYKAVEWRFLKLLSHLERECVDLQTIGSDNWGITEQE